MKTKHKPAEGNPSSNVATKENRSTRLQKNQKEITTSTENKEDQMSSEKSDQILKQLSEKLKTRAATKDKHPEKSLLNLEEVKGNATPTVNKGDQMSIEKSVNDQTRLAIG